MSDLLREIGSRLKSARINHGMTQEDLADMIGVAPPTISLWEHGHRRLRIDDIHEISQILGVEVSCFFPPLRISAVQSTQIINSLASQMGDEDLNDVVDFMKSKSR